MFLMSLVFMLSSPVAQLLHKLEINNIISPVVTGSKNEALHYDIVKSILFAILLSKLVKKLKCSVVLNYFFIFIYIQCLKFESFC